VTILNTIRRKKLTLLKADTHYPCSRPVFSGREYGPWTRVVCIGL